MSFSWRDHVVKGTPVGGPFDGRDTRFLSGNDLEIDVGQGADHMAGFGELPFAIVRKSNKPKIKIGGMAADELLSFCTTKLGGIGGFPFTFTVVIKRPGIQSRVIVAKLCETSAGGGWKAGEDGAKSDLEAICMDILYGIGNARPKSIYAKVNGR